MGKTRTPSRNASPRPKPYEECSSTSGPKISEPTELKIFCIVEGEATSFPVNTLSNRSVGELQQAIKAAKKPELDHVAADKLTLYKVSIPDEGKTIVESEIESKEALAIASKKLGNIFNSKLPDETIHIFVKLPPQETSEQILKRKMDEDPRYISASKKMRIEEGWREYRASDGKMVTLPPSWIAMLENPEDPPDPRNKFNHLKAVIRLVIEFDIPSLGRRPKQFKKYNSEFMITDQMLELWKEISAEQIFSYQRVLSGPMGVGKSYLFLFPCCKRICGRVAYPLYTRCRDIRWSYG
ncbi:hypothetical protein BCR41DRAFT_98142 [Lobosporangium transversale]|uniref:Crinkler effector protein N-terminal domain-containing protein n=1 Tax=Lobosporangium transversale TaxID=64571 RepID=A0A1Y2GLA3_9FUNG|nr:hypothetical protein BCR41DRAFT_98142 [Lobosporangium transversale]ORZ12933.1 hypothetical protein BCR41DRAFT_98142 [Lobosporangium transversale]|eukprot:XP_021880282.1 hypothetical protein BCR41DRAFT_98142 [Lobosporangium transversale]